MKLTSPNVLMDFQTDIFSKNLLSSLFDPKCILTKLQKQISKINHIANTKYTLLEKGFNSIFNTFTMKI